MIDDTMYGLVGRNALVVGAAVAAVLLIVQLRTSGIDDYAPADILSILLIAVPTVTRAVRPPPRRRQVRPPPAQDTDGEDTRPPPDPSRMDTGDAGAVERMLARGIAMVIAAGAWLLAVVLVLVQAWAPTVSALIVFGVAAAGVADRAEDAPVTSSPGRGHG